MIIGILVFRDKIAPEQSVVGASTRLSNLISLVKKFCQEVDHVGSKTELAVLWYEDTDQKFLNEEIVVDFEHPYIEGAGYPPGLGMLAKRRIE